MAEDKARVGRAREELKKSIDSGDMSGMKDKSEALTAILNEISTKVYQAAGAEGAGDRQPGADEDVVDADYEVVDDNE